MKYALIEKNTGNKVNTFKKRYFFEKNAILCYTIEYHILKMKENDLKEIDLYLAERENFPDMFYCKMFNEVGEK